MRTYRVRITRTLVEEAYVTAGAESAEAAIAIVAERLRVDPPLTLVWNEDPDAYVTEAVTSAEEL